MLILLLSVAASRSLAFVYTSSAGGCSEKLEPSLLITMNKELYEFPVISCGCDAEPRSGGACRQLVQTIVDTEGKSHTWKRGCVYTYLSVGVKQDIRLLTWVNSHLSWFKFARKIEMQRKLPSLSYLVLLSTGNSAWLEDNHLQDELMQGCWRRCRPQLRNIRMRKMRHCCCILSRYLKATLTVPHL